jgi:peroxiredoxin
MNFVLAYEYTSDRTMDVKRRIGLLLVIPAVVHLIITSLMAKAQSSASSQISSACESFGVVKSLVEKKAPPFSLKLLDGEQMVSLSDFRGKPVLLKFWAAWCPSCVEELAPMEKFSEGRKDQLIILLAAIDGEKEKKIRRFIKKNNITLPVLLDPKAKTARSYGVNFVPISFFINPEGSIVGTVVGERDWVSPKAWSAVKELFNLR